MVLFYFYYILYYLLYFAMFGCYLLEACSFQLKDRKRVDSDSKRGGEKLQGLEERENAIRIYFMRIKIFQINK